MDRGYTHNPDGTYTLTHGDDIGPTLAADTTPGDFAAALEAFCGPDLSMPDEIDMHQVLMFLDQTNDLTAVTNFLNSLPGPMKRLANIEFSRAPKFVPASALGMAVAAALFPDAETRPALYAEACRDMAAFTVDDYGDPSPTVLQAIAKFLFGG